ncbi:structural protein [Pseudomonas phage vB_PaeM_PA5oct]|uniref:Structural protein n=1 Tax=Pseudomonas phage vB_PaeM_PA5oct TaxID=2163605 RepID=A0A4Y1LUV5_9CAUD|nr:virion structural protein [Pseudomonas phage vB_PaeM_PA5oct]QCG76176.1 structural protein [Pseudomonas phage vB_PaeM_PA5oct]WPK39291.1 virion structural protein [Pseudomonas phage Deifobo]BDR25751.1 hypothetical protein RVBP16_1910 [Pseudomonas phage sp. 30-2]
MNKHNADTARENLVQIAGNNKVLDMLIELEKTLDNCNVFSYANWNKGELVAGPFISRYWVTTTWMYNEKDMPDPDAGLRLLKYGCKVKYERDVFLEPKKVTGRPDYENPATKQAKIEELPIWLVTITMPRKFIDEAIIDGMQDFSNVDDIDPSAIADVEAAGENGINDVDGNL